LAGVHPGCPTSQFGTLVSEVPVEIASFDPPIVFSPLKGISAVYKLGVRFLLCGILQSSSCFSLDFYLRAALSLERLPPYRKIAN
jgi:hypothetical protein